MFAKKHTSGFGGAVTALAIGLLSTWCAEVAAQESNPPAVVAERDAKVWEAQAKTVAADLALSGEQTTKLVEAYAAARESHATAAGAVAGPAERPDPQKMKEVTQAERAKFESALKAFLDEKQREQALLTLGSFFRRWDGMVEVLGEMDLAEEVREKALKRTAAYVAEWNKAMEAARASEDRESMREKANALKEKLDADMAALLSREQMAKWADATDKRGGRGK